MTNPSKSTKQLPHCSGCFDNDSLGGTHSFDTLEHGRQPKHTSSKSSDMSTNMTSNMSIKQKVSKCCKKAAVIGYGNENEYWCIGCGKPCEFYVASPQNKEGIEKVEVRDLSVTQQQINKLQDKLNEVIRAINKQEEEIKDLQDCITETVIMNAEIINKHNARIESLEKELKEHKLRMDAQHIRITELEVLTVKQEKLIKQLQTHEI